MAEEKKTIKFTFRKAAERDLPVVIDMFEKAFRKFVPDSVNSTRMFNKALVDEQNQELIVAEDTDGNIAGFVLMNARHTQYRGEINVDSVVVDEKYRGQGLGRGLMEKAEEIARHFNFKTMTLQVHEQNAPAIALYESMGYTAKDIISRHYADGKDAYLMKKPLTPKWGKQALYTFPSQGYRA